MKKIIQKILFPVECLGCGSVNTDKFNICNDCYYSISKSSYKSCPICAHKIDYNMKTCSKHKDSEIIIDNIYISYYYNDIMKKLIKNFKYSGKVYLKELFSHILAQTFRYNFIGEVDHVISIPMHKQKKRKRGYDQAELIAKEFAKKIDLVYLESALVRKRKTVPQYELKKQEREKNLESVFEIKEEISNKKIVLIDDIVTTCATIKNAAALLKNKGAKEITVLALAHGR